MNIVWNIIFVLILLGAALAFNLKAMFAPSVLTLTLFRLKRPVPWWIVNLFFAAVFLGWILKVVGLID